MILPYRIKWFVSVLLALGVLALGLVGGSWGTSYAANTEKLAPYIDKIEPAKVKVGTSYIVMIITGSGFEINKNARVRLTAVGIDEILDAPITTLPDAISQLIPGTYLAEPRTYDLYVVQSGADIPTIPTIPIWPGVDEVSNPVPFIVYQPELIFIPILNK
jgi:hypothetical protein